MFSLLLMTQSPINKESRELFELRYWIGRGGSETSRPD